MFKILFFWTEYFKKIHKLIFRSWLGPFLASFFVLVFILMLPFVTQYRDEIFGKGLETVVLLKVFGLATLNAIPMALPLAILLSTLITMGNLGERYELAAMKANGISLIKIMRPLILGTGILMFSLLAFNFYIYPQVNQKLFTLVYDLGQLKPSFALKEGHFYNGVDGLVIHTKEINRETDMLYGVKIYDHTEKVGNNRITLADSGIMVPSTQVGQLTMSLYRGVVHEESAKKPGKPAGTTYSRFYFDTLQYRVDLTGFELDESEGTVLAKHHLTCDIHQLYYSADSMTDRLAGIEEDLDIYIDKYTHLEPQEIPEQEKRPHAVDTLEFEPDGVILADANTEVNSWFPDLPAHEIVTKALQTSRAVKNYSNIIQERLDREGERRRKFIMELDRRYAGPFACLVFLFIGAPLGAIVRKGGIGLPVIFCIIFFVIFYILQINGNKLAKDGIIDPAIGIWLPAMVLSPIAIWFTYSSMTDSPLLYMTGWRRFTRGVLWVVTFGKRGRITKEVRPTLSVDEIVLRRQQQKEEAQRRLEEYRDKRLAKEKAKNQA